MTRCALCNHELERRTDEAKAETGIDDEWLHIVPTSDGTGFGTLASHETVPVDDPTPAHAG